MAEAELEAIGDWIAEANPTRALSFVIELRRRCEPARIRRPISVPAVYQRPDNAKEGGQLSYGADFRELSHRAAGYVDKILRGAKPSEPSVQMPQFCDAGC